MAPSGSLSKKLLVSAVVLVLAEAVALVVLGARVRRLQWREPPRRDEALLREAELLTEGPYRLSDDPLVGFELKRSFTYRFHEVEAHVDRDGRRQRTGPPPQPGSLRVVLVGDSVAFGFGVADDETYAARLEELLAAALPADAPPPVVLTVACPGWNHRSSLRELRGALGPLRPDVVLYLAVNNDLDDATSVTETGQRRVWIDPVRGPERPVSSVESFHTFLTSLQGLPSLEWAQALREVGKRAAERVLVSGLSPESRARWEAIVADVRETRERVEACGGAFAVVLGSDNDFERLLELRLAEAAPDLPVLGLFSGYFPADTLVTDPHPNPRCILAGAHRMASFLIERGWVEGASAERLPAGDPEYAARAWERPSPEERARWWSETRALLERFLEPAVDVPAVVGIHQVYGGMDGDGTVGRALFVALRDTSGARSLSVELARPAEPTLYPLALEVEVGGRVAARIDVPRPAEEGERFAFRVDLTDAEATTEILDVLVHASTAVIESGPRGPRLAAFRLRRIERG